MSKTRLYFAYGSNLLPARLKARTPSARLIGNAILSGHRLYWHKHGIDDTGKCDIVATGQSRHQVLGAVYSIDVGEWHHLDHAEELGTGYQACTATVLLRGEPVEAHSYRALITNPDLKPFDWYKEFVMTGARQHGFPEDYIRQLDCMPALADPDPQRAEFNRRLLTA
ncbi:MAG: gamma-glutamylcyclotransferase family protein [Wenzhouxiangellaceae bacterium]|nr:gamma-glutamylcyclotransferase family protein [Wenzhouxiangellaceae bacterium]